MFQHEGKNRTHAHNLGIASVLSFVAGMVNVTGYFTVFEMTTNVTGHFVFFTSKLVEKDYYPALGYVAYVLLFLLGAFTSNLITQLIARRKHTSIYTAPAFIEASIFALLAYYGQELVAIHPNLLAFALLFSMGFQNALVTSISDAIVRTTHLTGLFTDLGIECAQWFFYRKPDERRKLKISMRLRATIIGSFLLGALVSGYSYERFGLHTLFLPSAVLFFILAYDYIQMRISAMNFWR